MRQGAGREVRGGHVSKEGHNVRINRAGTGRDGECAYVRTLEAKLSNHGQQYEQGNPACTYRKIKQVIRK